MSSRLQEFTPDSIRQSYARKFGIVLLVLGIVVASVGVVAAGSMQAQLNSQTEDRLGSIAAQEASAVEAWHERNTGLGPAVVRSQDVQQGSQDQIQRGLARWGRRMPESAQSIHYVNYDDDTIVASTDDDQVGTSLSGLDVPWTSQDSFRIIASSSSYAGQYVTDTYEGTAAGSSVPMVAYVTKVPNVANEYVVIEMRLDVVAETDQGGELTGSNLVVIDENDRVISHEMFMPEGAEMDMSVHEQKETLHPYTNGPVDEIRGSGSASVTRHDGQPGPFSGLFSSGDGNVVAYAPVGQTGWYVIVETPMTTAYSSNVAQLGLLSTLVGLAMIGAVGLVLGRNTSRSIDQLSQKAQQIEEGDFDVDLQSDRIDSVGELYASFNSMRDTIRENIAATERARFETEQLNRELEMQADEYSDVMQACASGDLTERMDPESDSEAMTAIATEFNGMMDEIERTVGDLRAFADEVAVSTQEVAMSADVVRDEADRTAEAMHDISSAADDQNETLQEATRLMTEHRETMEAIAAASSDAASVAERTAEMGRSGREAAQEAITGMEEVEQQSEETVREIERLESEVEQIDELIEFISDVAEQTNMLALNANIEASRAGESGEGFAVVAGEIKELAAETKQAAGDIEQRLERIREQTGETVGEVRQTSDRIAENAKSVHNAADALENIAEHAQETNADVQEISDATQEQAEATEDVVSTVDDAADISEDTAAESEGVARAAETQTMALTEMSEGAEDLADQATQLSETLDRFTTDAEGPAPDAEADADGAVEAEADADGAVEAEADADGAVEAEADADGAVEAEADAADSDDDADPAAEPAVEEAEDVEDAESASERPTPDASDDD